MTGVTRTADDLLAAGGSYRDRMLDAQAGKQVQPATASATSNDGADDGADGQAATAPAGGSVIGKAKSFWAKVSVRPGMAHLIRAGKRFGERLGNQFGAAITYFSFLAVIPVLMAAFGITALVLNQPTINQLKDKANHLVPGGFMSKAIDEAITHGAAVGIIGLVIAIYSGIGWMGNVRDAVQSQWRPQFEKTQAEEKQKFYVRMSKDLLTLLGLGLALLASMVLTTVGGAAQSEVLKLLGLDGIGWLRPVFSVVPFVLAIAADVIIFGWFYRMMEIPDFTPPKGAVLKGAVIAAVGFEVLKVAVTLLGSKLSQSPTAVAFGSVIVLLFFFNLVARLILFVAAWIGTARADVMGEELPAIPGALVVAHRPVSKQRTAGLVGAGAIVGFLTGRRRRR
ncbi:MAG: inner membrane protein YhjD [Actinomycetota bacterium]|nr:inner membrane protein YhjD [Actinomycetota bacterium]